MKGSGPRFVASSLALLGMLVSTCAPAQPPTPGLKPVATPVATVAAAPTATPAASPVPPAVATPSPTPRPTIPTPVTAPAEKPRYGGILKRNNSGDPAHFDMHQETTFRINILVAPAYSLLVQYDPLDPNAEKVLPDLAEKWEVSPDGKVYTFYLRKGVKFHDGKPATSADVKASFDRIIWPPKGVVSARQAFFAGVERVEAPDPYTVRFVLKFPQTTFLGLVAAPYHYIFPKHILDAKGDMKRDVVGTGPFKFHDYTRGVSYELVKNPEYFLPGRPYLDGIKFYIIRDFAAISAAVRTRQIQLTWGNQHAIRAKERDLLRKQYPEMVVQVRSDNVTIYMLPNVAKAPWSDVRVRKALHLALDRQPFIDIVGDGEGVIGGHMNPGPWAIPREELLKMPGYRSPKDQDIEEARRLLGQAGFPNGFKTTIFTRSAVPAYVNAAVVAKEQLRKIGIEVSDITPYEDVTYYARMRGSDFELASVLTATVLTDPAGIFAIMYVRGGGHNWGPYSNPQVEEMYLKQMQIADPAERKKLILEMQGVIGEDYPKSILYWQTQSAFFWPEVRGYTLQPSAVWGHKMQDVWLAQ